MKDCLMVGRTDDSGWRMKRKTGRSMSLMEGSMVSIACGAEPCLIA